jgi:hypothetical protein
VKAWADFLPDVLVHVPGCPDPVAEHALLRAAQEFFETTRLWMEWLREQYTVAGLMDYPRVLPNQADLVRLERATLNGRQIEVRSEEDLPADWQTYPQTVCTGVHTTDRETLYLVPSTQDGQVLLVQASLKPSDDATGVEDHLFAHHAKHIACGAVAALKYHAEKTYSDPANAIVYRAKFEDAMNTVEFQRRRGYTSARPRRQIKTF